MANRPTDWHVLDLDRDPVPGDPYEVKELARKLGDFADDVSSALRSVKGLSGNNAVQDWAGLAADAYREQFGDLPGELTKLEKSYRLASGALEAYWPKLETAQADADRALAQGRTARQDLDAAKTTQGNANDWVKRAGDKSKEYQADPKPGVEPPSAEEVRTATRNALDASNAQKSANAAVHEAQQRLDAAKELAAQAAHLRDTAASTAEHALHEASDAGIKNKHWWEKAVDWVADHWDEIVAVCKVIVAVLGIIVLIIGGPLAWLVLAAALVVLADTLIKYAQGKASLWDVAFAALDCIPMFKGLTTLGGLAKMAKSLPALLKSGKALENIANSVRKGGQAFKDVFTSLRRGAKDDIAAGKPFSGRCKGGDPIDMISGEMLLADRDVALAGILTLLLTRTHVSSYRTGRWFGPSWSSTLDQRLEADGDGLVFAADDAMMLVYPVPRPGGPIMPTRGPRWPLEWDGTPEGEIRITDPASGIVRHFTPVDSPTGAPAGLMSLGLTAISDANGNRIDIERAADGTPLAVRHSGGYHLAVDTFDRRITALRLLGTEDGPEGTVLRRYGYSVNGDLTEVTDALGNTERLEYDADGRVVRRTDRAGRWYGWEYDPADRCVSGVGQDGYLSCSITYDDEARSTVYTNSLGHSTTYRYNERMQLVSSTNALGETLVNEWDEFDRLVAQTDALGATTRYAYDEEGDIVAAVRPDGASTGAVYDERRRLVRAVEPDGTAWLHTYDDAGNVTSTVNPAGGRTEYAYDAVGALAAVTDAMGRTSRSRNNAAGLPVEFTDARGAVSTIERDPFGRVSTFTDPLGQVTRFGWTAEGRPVWREQGTGESEFWEWDGEGHLVSHIDAVGRTASFTVGPFGVATARELADGSRYDYAFDSELNLLTVTDPRQRVWRYSYDAANRVRSETDFSGRVLRYELDAMGELIARTNAAGETIRFGRDVFGRTVETHYDGHTARLTYDISGNIVRETGPGITVEREYDAAGALLWESVNGRTTTYAYDVLGRRTRRRTPTGVESTWTYDGVGSPTALETAGHRMTFGYDEALQETHRGLPGGVSLTQSWDPAGRISEQRLDRAAEPLQQRAYTYRPDGVPTSVAELTSGTRRFTLDPANRVSAVDARGWTERYSYDPAGNMTRAETPGADGEEAVRAFAGNRIRRSGRTTFEHDAEGRIVRSVHRLLNGQSRVRTFTWNSQSQLVATTTPDGARWQYTYDPAGRRTAKARVDAGGAPVEQTVFVWDGARLIEQISADGRSTSWDYKPSSFLPVAQLDRAGTDARFHAVVTDLTGAPAELVSADGELAWSRRTTLWGAPLPPQALGGGDGGVDCPLRFPGQYADEETGWHYNYQRYYDPRTGQYVTPDPLGLTAGPNDTAYVPNPFTLTDPLGLHWQDPNNGNKFGRDPSLPPKTDEGPKYTRNNQYGTEYRQSTHDHMTEHYTDEGRTQGRAPLDADGKRIPREDLNWYDGQGRKIWDPNAENPKPFHKTVTYEHLDPVVDHWNREGRFTDKATRKDFYNNTDHMEPMGAKENSRGGGKMTATYSQEVGPGYSCT
ncbi:RHS repeat-associated core domain-containing protein [Streptomyces sp. NPDC006733]|uniref:RHS repeat-associated core domain-containing protein n=1 Tax=Streptomyces sp. NPDC006733 TaxID=3155460 RepID=UPI0033D191BB